MSTVASNRKGLVPVTARDLRPGDHGGSLMAGRHVLSVGEAGDGRVEVLVRWSRTGNTEKLRIRDDWSGRVHRDVVGSGLALRWSGAARSTGRPVEVWDTEHAETQIPATAVRGHKWAMRCEHGTVIGRSTLARAKSDAADPRLWCLSCVETQPAALPLG